MVLRLIGGDAVANYKYGTVENYRSSRSYFVIKSGGASVVSGFLYALKLFLSALEW